MPQPCHHPRGFIRLRCVNEACNLFFLWCPDCGSPLELCPDCRPDYHHHEPAYWQEKRRQRQALAKREERKNHHARVRAREKRYYELHKEAISIRRKELRQLKKEAALGKTQPIPPRRGRPPKSHPARFA